MSNHNADSSKPRIIFPCEYPLKIIGIATPDFKFFVTSVIQKYFPSFDAENILLKDSRHSNYQSISVTLQIEEEQQIHDIFAELKMDYRVKLVL